MAKYKVIGIVWDIDPYEPGIIQPPKDTVIWAEDEDYVVDALSDKYGWCICSVDEIRKI